MCVVCDSIGQDGGADELCGRCRRRAEQGLPPINEVRAEERRKANQQWIPLSDQAFSLTFGPDVIRARPA
jgi:hypothetical protein